MMVMMGIDCDVLPGSGQSGRRSNLTHLSLLPETSPSIPIITIILELVDNCARRPTRRWTYPTYPDLPWLGLPGDSAARPSLQPPPLGPLPRFEMPLREWEISDPQRKPPAYPT
jgi:hypothetical protein